MNDDLLASTITETLEFMTNIMSLTGNEARRMAQKALAKMEGKK